MPNHKIGVNYSFTQLHKAYNADPQNDPDAHFVLYREEEILALVLRQKFNHKTTEVWVGNDPVVAEWGKRLATLKDRQTVPLYYSRRGRSLYEYMGQQLITGDTDDPNELARRKGPVPLSLVVFLKPVEAPSFAPPR